MQEHGVVVGSSENGCGMENLASSTTGGVNNSACANSSQETNERAKEQENSKPLPKEQDLPLNESSSSYENIPLDFVNDAEQIPSILDAGFAKPNEEKSVNSGDERTQSLTDIPNFETPRTTDDGKSMSDNVTSVASECEKVENLYSHSRNDDPGKEFIGTLEEVSIEDSCESRPVYSREKIDKQSVYSKSARANCSEVRPPTLSEDSKLVKISLPTSSINIMQTNAQFLNKSRNFLNFITEKSTNIMEKTLLPQHLAVRYNSILKMSESPGGAIEKKNSEQSSNAREPSTTNSTIGSQQNGIPETRMIVDIPSNEISLLTEKNENSRDPQNVLSKNSVADQIDEFSTNLDASVIPNDSIAPKSESLSPLVNDLPQSLDNSLENGESTSKNVTEDEKESLSLVSDVSDNCSNGLLRHPVYLTLVRDYAKTREEKIKLAERVENLEARNRILEAQNSGELFNVQLEALEKTVERLTIELRAANVNQEELGREYAAANKERESMVMKYAVSEKQLIDTQKARDYAERRYKEIAKDHELLQNKLRQAQTEKTRICSILDTKCRELTDSQKEIERLKEDVNVRDVKLKWTQTKLKTEMETQKDTQMKLDKAMTRINEMKEECDQVRRESQDMITKFQHSEENKAVTLDQQLKEQQARLILERHVTEDKENLRLQLQKEVDLLKNRQQALIEENNSLSLKIQDLEKSRLSYESKLSDLKIVADQRQKEIVDLSAKVSHLETLKLQLIHKEQCLVSNEAEVERLRQVNQELQADMDCCRQREAHMLDFTQKLTDKNVRLQSEFTAIEAKAAQLENEQGPLREGIVELRGIVKNLEESLSQERKKRTEECEILARHLAEQTQLAKNFGQKFEDSQGEIAVLRRKQQISVKEMSRELQQCRKRLEAYESASPSNSLDPTSRTGSNTSLNAGEILNGISSDNGGNGEISRPSTELDKQSLIDRILKMQKVNVRRAEKLDFLEEHTRTLVAELQKKTKIIQNYILHENFDAMGSNERDRHKAELARYGGIMASVYSQRVSDDNMTLELSLEINQKLQAVLEDALLKNITLKDNIDTLGEEIARLTIRNQQMLQQKGK